MRVIGTTVIFAPSAIEELALADEVVVLDDGVAVQQGPYRRVYAGPESEAVARATGDVSVVPLTIRNGVVHSVIGSWPSEAFEGSGIALCRPEHFTLAERGQESDVLLAIESARFAAGRWLVSGNLSGAVTLTVSLDATQTVSRGKLLALRYDPERFALREKEIAMPEGAQVPVDVVPSRASSR
jgi:ABC-type sulfate/molybdate transport systems ATPase subunit